jgi:cytochrome c nitrite reductase small subunit
VIVVRWRWIIGTVLLLLVGVAFAIPLVATANDDVGFCLSCHVMEDVGKSHATSFHRDVATCSDCHTGSLLQKYTDGARHVTANLTGAYPHPIALREVSKEVIAGQCAQCHAEKSLHVRTKQSKGQNCLECHSGHIPKPNNIQGLQ